MPIFVLGASHRSASPAVLSQLALSGGKIAELSSRLRASDHVTGHFVLVTCTRAELYLSAPAFHPAYEAALEAWAATLGLYPAWLRSALSTHHDEQAVAHAFSVTTGLESLAPGEPQIHGQFREAYNRACREGHVDPALHALCNAALRTSRSVRKETNLTSVAPSLVDLGLDVALAALEPVAQPRVVVLGAGSMGSLTASTLARRREGPGVIYARDPLAGRQLASRLGGEWTSTTELGQALRNADLVVGALGTSRPVVTAGTLDTVAHPRRQVFLDLGVPPNIDPDVVGAHPHTRRIDLHELARTPDASHQRALDAAQDQVRAHVAEYLMHAHQAALAPAITAMRQNAASAVRDEVARAARGQSVITIDDLDAALNRLAGRLLHAPTLASREALNHTESPQLLAEALHRVYATAMTPAAG